MLGNVSEGIAVRLVDVEEEPETRVEMTSRTLNGEDLWVLGCSS